MKLLCKLYAFPLAYYSWEKYVDALNDESDHRDHEGGDGAVRGTLGVVDAEAAVLRPRHFQSV